MRGGTPDAEDKEVSVIGTKRVDNSKPKRYHNVFSHFHNDPNCELCRMTKTTGAGCKNRPLNRAGGTPPPTTLGELITADHKI